MAIGSLFSGPIVNRGRRKAMMLGNAIIFVSALV
jgi:hypothetical protein